jgi:hypothetical protein
MSVGEARDRRISALPNKLKSLADEIEDWRQRAASKEFAIHRSQLRDVCAGLELMHEELRAEAAVVAKNSATISVDNVVALEQKILAVIQIWQCYRDKFALRLLEPLRRQLSLFDDLAWEAYRPARDRVFIAAVQADVQKPVPPLVFPNPNWSPFARSRETAFQIDESTGDPVALAHFDEHVRSIPVPLIGVPWYQLSHLPDAIFVGHEVGHLVEDDFGLSEELRAAILAALADAPELRRAAWSRHWRSEVFADAYGVLVGGPAFAIALIDLLAGAAPSVTEIKASLSGERWSGYPTRALRALLVAEFVARLPPDAANTKLFTSLAAEMRAPWEKSLSTFEREYAEDIPAVATAIYSTPLEAFASGHGQPGVAVSTIITFDAAMHAATLQAAQRAENGQAQITSDVRVLFAAMSRSFQEDHLRFGQQQVQERLRKRMIEKRNEAPRSAVLDKLTKDEIQKRNRFIGSRLSASLKLLSFGKPAG